MKEIKFNRTALESNSFGDYRQIEKSGDLQFDLAKDSDDAIVLYTKNDYKKIIIDCDKQTGIFSLKFDEDLLNNQQQ